jgi:hypothetical protein
VRFGGLDLASSRCVIHGRRHSAGGRSRVDMENPALRQYEARSHLIVSTSS